MSTFGDVYMKIPPKEPVSPALAVTIIVGAIAAVVSCALIYGTFFVIACREFPGW